MGWNRVEATTGGEKGEGLLGVGLNEEGRPVPIGQAVAITPLPQVPTIGIRGYMLELSASGANHYHTLIGNDVLKHRRILAITDICSPLVNIGIPYLKELLPDDLHQAGLAPKYLLVGSDGPCQLVCLVPQLGYLKASQPVQAKVQNGPGLLSGEP